MRIARLLSLLTLCLCLCLSGPALADDEKDDNPGALYARALLLENGDGKTEQAIKLYTQICERHADSRVFAARAMYRLGLCHRRQGSLERATQAFRSVIKRYPEQKEVAQLAARALDAVARRGDEREEGEQTRHLERLMRKLKEAGVPGELIERRIQLEREMREMRKHLDGALEQIRRRLGENEKARAPKVEAAKQQIEKVLHQLEKRLSNNKRLAKLFEKLNQRKEEGDEHGLEQLEKLIQQATKQFEDTRRRIERRQKEALGKLERLLDQLRGDGEGEREDGDRRLEQELERWGKKLQELGVPEKLIELRLELVRQTQQARQRFGKRIDQLEGQFRKRGKDWQHGFENSVRRWKELQRTLEKRRHNLDDLLKLYERLRGAEEMTEDALAKLKKRLDRANHRWHDIQSELASRQEKIQARLEALLRELGGEERKHGNEREEREDEDGERELKRALERAKALVEQLKQELHRKAKRLKELERKLQRKGAKEEDDEDY